MSLCSKDAIDVGIYMYIEGHAGSWLCNTYNYRRHMIWV